jgi:hypothetical protein
MRSYGVNLALFNFLVHGKSLGWVTSSVEAAAAWVQPKAALRARWWGFNCQKNKSINVLE